MAKEESMENPWLFQEINVILPKRTQRISSLLEYPLLSDSKFSDKKFWQQVQLGGSWDLSPGPNKVLLKAKRLQLKPFLKFQRAQLQLSLKY